MISETEGYTRAHIWMVGKYGYVRELERKIHENVESLSGGPLLVSQTLPRSFRS